MKMLSEVIKEKRQQFSQHPFFLISIDPQQPIEQSFAFLHKIAFFIMSFGDLNKFIIPIENPKNDLEMAINVHATEDATHWPWYLNDLRALNQNQSQPITETLEWLWSTEMEANRTLMYSLIEMFTQQPAKIRLVIIESIEAIGRVVFTYFNEIAKHSPFPLDYCGDLHLGHESGHTMGSEAELIDTIDYNEEEYFLSLKLIDKTFVLFSNLIDDL